MGRRLKRGRQETDRAGIYGPAGGPGLLPVEKWGVLERLWPESDVTRTVFWKEFFGSYVGVGL